MSTQHTPTPWLVNSLTRRGNNGSYRWLITTEEGNDAEVVATVPAPGMDTNASREDSIAEANAAFIVRACNSHDALVAALRELTRTAHGYDSHTGARNDTDGGRRAYAKAQAALDSALGVAGDLLTALAAATE